MPDFNAARFGLGGPLAAALGSLKLRITLGAIAALALGIGLATLLLVRQAERDTLNAAQQREVSEAARTADILSHRIVDLQRALQATAAQLGADKLSDPARLADFIEHRPVLRSLFMSVFAVSLDGRGRVFTDEVEPAGNALDVADRDYFRRTLAEGRALISSALVSRVSGQPVIVLTYPLRDASGTYGMLAGAINLHRRDLIEDLVKSPDAALGALVVVTDASGRILSHPQPERLMQTLADEPRLASAFADWVAAGSAVEPSGLRLTQGRDLIGAAGVAGPDWMVWRALPQSELLAPLHSARRTALGWAAGLIALMSLALLALLQWLLRPLALLERRAQRLFDTAQDPHTGWPATGGEIGRVAQVLRHVGAEHAQLSACNAQLLQKLGSVMSAAPVGIAFTRAQRFELVSAEFCRLFGRSEAELLGQPVQQGYAALADYDTLAAESARTFAAGQPFVGERHMRRADGSLFWARLRGRPVDASNPLAGAIWTLNDISEQIAAREQLRHSALHDALTGLANRRVFEQAVQQVFDARGSGLSAVVVMIDLDHFKPINDNAGHAAGDAVLRAVATALTGCVRNSDLVVRLGGDEFALLLQNCGPAAALRIAEQARLAIGAVVLPWHGRNLRLGASLGLAALGPEFADAAAWVQAADAACYAVKGAGRGAVGTSTRSPAPAREDALAQSGR